MAHQFVGPHLGWLNHNGLVRVPPGRFLYAVDPLIEGVVKFRRGLDGLIYVHVFFTCRSAVDCRFLQHRRDVRSPGIFCLFDKRLASRRRRTFAKRHCFTPHFPRLGVFYKLSFFAQHVALTQALDGIFGCAQRFFLGVAGAEQFFGVRCPRVLFGWACLKPFGQFSSRRFFGQCFKLFQQPIAALVRFFCNSHVAATLGVGVVSVGIPNLGHQPFNSRAYLLGHLGIAQRLQVLIDLDCGGLALHRFLKHGVKEVKVGLTRSTQFFNLPQRRLVQRQRVFGCCGLLLFKRSCTLLKFFFAGCKLAFFYSCYPQLKRVKNCIAA